MNKDDIIEKISNILSNYPKIRTALLFGSYYYGDNNESSDVDIAVYTDYDIFELNDIEEAIKQELSMEVDLCNIDDLSKTLKEELIVSRDNVIYLKDDNWDDWLGYVDYLIQEIQFKNLYNSMEI